MQQVSQQIVIDKSELHDSTDQDQQANQSANHREIVDEKKVSNFFVWGDNSRGQLALSDMSQYVTDPVAISLSSMGKLKSIACGLAHSVLITEQGYVFTMGDNSFGQLGLSRLQKSHSSHPVLVAGLGPQPGLGINEAHCADNASFVLVKADKEDQSDQVYSWGSQAGGVLGREALTEELQSRPTKVEFAKHIKISKVSIGSNHAACVTTEHQVYTWGANEKGQLGIGDATDRVSPTINPLVEDQQTAQISCGKCFTFLISGQNEIMISGKLPFTVQTELGEEQDFIMTFQSIAQFDQRVRIVQVETSRFASIVVDPVEEGQPVELFFWGQCPLGVFNELTPLNQLYSGSYEQQNESQATQTFNVRAVKNGLNFCVFVDQESGMTFQVGAENMADPYLDDALVSLSELRDAQFTDIQRFACGSNFVLGESITSSTIMQGSPMKKLNESQVQSSPVKKVTSPLKKTQKQQVAAKDGLILVSPDGSKQSFPQRALYQGSISPSTPTEQQSSMHSLSEQKNMKFHHKDLMGALKHVEGCQPIISETPKISSTYDRNSTGQDLHTFEGVNEKQFNKTGQIDLAGIKDIRIIEQEEEDSDMLKPVESVTPDTHRQQTDRDAQQPKKQFTSDKITNEILTAQKRQEKKPTYSPDVSPINGTQIWDGNSYNPNQSNEMQLDSVKCQDQRAFRIDDSQSKCLLNVQQQLPQQLPHITNQMPLQMQQNNHQIYQQLTQQVSRSPDSHQNLAIARFLPVQQQTSLQSTPQRANRHQNQLGFQAFQQQQQQQQPQIYATTPTIMMQSMDQSINQSGFLNYTPSHQNEQQNFYEQVMKEKMESAQLQGQLKEAQRQLDKSRKDYAKLLSQVDEDQEETAQLKEKVRQQEASISQMTIKSKDQDASLEKLQTEKGKLESEVKETSQGYISLQSDLAVAQEKIKDFETSKLNCMSEKCRVNDKDLNAQLQKKSKEIYDLTVRLGCLETENRDLRAQLEDRSHLQDSKIDGSRILVEQELDETCKQLKDLQEAYNKAKSQIATLKKATQKNKTKLLSTGVQTSNPLASSKACQTPASRNSQSENRPKQVKKSQPTSSSKVDKKQEPTLLLPDMPLAIFDSIDDTIEIEMDQSFDASISFNNAEHQESSHGHDSINSLKEFRSIEKQVRVNRQSQELPKVFSGPLAQRQSISKLNLYQTSQDDREKPKHNFMVNRSNASLEPKILQTARGSRERNFLLKEDQNRSTNFVPNFPDLTHKQENADLSMINLDDRSAEQEESWQTFKPMTTCPNERYSLKRHQEIFMESQFSQKDESNDEPETQQNSNHVEPQQNQSSGALPVSRRTKSNSDAGCLQLNSQQKNARRGRHERQGVVLKSAVHENQSNYDEGASHRSIGVKSNMTTPRRPIQANQTGLNHEEMSNKGGLTDRRDIIQSKSNGSLLRYPTIIENSPVCEATIKRIGSAQKLSFGTTPQPQPYKNVPQSTRNQQIGERIMQINDKRQQCPTPQQRHNDLVSKKFFAAKSNSMNAGIVRQRPTTSHQQMLVNRSAMQTARPSVSGSNMQAIEHSQSHAQLSSHVTQQTSANRSVTPRVKSTSQQNHGSLYSQSVLGYQNRASAKPQSVGTKATSATARRVAYDHRRKLARQSMKSMAQQPAIQTQGSSINRQARAAVAQVNQANSRNQSPFRPENTSLSIQEEPFTHIPQKSMKPEMSIVEDPDIPLMGLVGSKDQSPAQNDGEIIHNNIERQKMSETMLSAPLNTCIEQNPFLNVPTVPNRSNYEGSHKGGEMKQQQYLHTEQEQHPQHLSCQSAKTLNYTENISENRSQDPSHLNEMKEKLYQIQSNKMLLESKIKEYESKLKQISQEPETQEILAKLKSRSASRKDDASTENVFGDMSNTCSELTLGESGRTSRKHTPGQKVKSSKRIAFAQLQNTSNINQNSSQNISFNGSQVSNGGKAYRDCKLTAPANPPSRIKPQNNVMPRSHYANQPIFRR